MASKHTPMRMADIFDLPVCPTNIETKVNPTARLMDVIAHAVNCHDDLVEALGLLVADVAGYEAWDRPCLALDVARAALAKARGEG